MTIQRPKYLEMLIAGQGNGLVKIVTGGRRCGKSFLLFVLFRNYLLRQGVEEDHIIGISFDDRRSRALRDPDTLLDYIDTRLQKDGKTHYIILDEIQFVDDFVGVLLSLTRNPQLDIYVSGSNSRFLSKDVVTEFRGRGDEIHVWPLSFSEYYSAVGGDRLSAWQDYYTYGGLPLVPQLPTEQKKMEYLQNIYELTYLKDVIERNRLRNVEGLKQLVQILASSIGSPVNPTRISNTFKSREQVSIKPSTIKEYIDYLQDAFLVEGALRYDVKGRKYIGTETKYYFADLGIRNAVLNFRQQEESHIMENMIYNELRRRGYLVDVGMVQVWENNKGDRNVSGYKGGDMAGSNGKNRDGGSVNGKNNRRKLEVDFVVNRGAERVYIQSVYRMHSPEKRKQEQRPLLNIGDNFRKVIIVGDDIKSKVDENGIITVSLMDFLLGDSW